MSRSRTGLATAARRHPLFIGVTVLYVAVWIAYGIATDTGGVYAYLVWMACAVVLLMYVDGPARFSTHVLVLLCMSASAIWREPTSMSLALSSTGRSGSGSSVTITWSMSSVWVQPGWPSGRRRAGC